MLGEHIRALKAGRWNHAIDCGDETVIHLAEEGARRAVRRSYRPEFVSGAEVVEIVTHRQRTFPADEVVARAYSRIADPALAAMFATSESFAHWCATGRPWAPGEDLPRVAAPAPAAPPAKARSVPARPARKARRPKAKGAPRLGGARAKPRPGAGAPRAKGMKGAAAGAGRTKAKRPGSRAASPRTKASGRAARRRPAAKRR